MSYSLVVAALLLSLFYGFSSGTRNVFAGLLVTFLIGYALAMPQDHKKIFLVLCGVGALSDSASQFAAARSVLPELRRPWLHAAVLGFTHPVTGEPMRFVAPLPADLAQTLVPLGLKAPPLESATG